LLGVKVKGLKKKRLLPAVTEKNQYSLCPLPRFKHSIYRKQVRSVVFTKVGSITTHTRILTFREILQFGIDENVNANK
jgi:hypothetical protein